MFVRTMKVTAWGLMRDKEKMMIKKEPYGTSQINLLSLDSRPHFSAFLRGLSHIFFAFRGEDVRAIRISFLCIPIWSPCLHVDASRGILIRGFSPFSFSL